MTESAQAAFFEAHGISAATYRRTYESAEVTKACAEADSKARAYHVDRVPTIVVYNDTSFDPTDVVRRMAAQGHADPDERAVLESMVAAADEYVSRDLLNEEMRT